MKIYLAGPVDYSADGGKSWKDELRDGMLNKGQPVVFFDPAVSYKFDAIDDSVSCYIHDVNMYAMRSADLVVARLMKGDTSIGTPIELYDAARKNMCVIIITDMDKSVYLNYMQSREALLVKSVKEAIDVLLGPLELKEKLFVQCDRNGGYSVRTNDSQIKNGDLLTVCGCGGVRKC